jgi:hypothetical protein
VLFRDDQQVNRSLGIDVGECDAKLVFIDAICRNIPGEDLAE